MGINLPITRFLSKILSPDQYQSFGGVLNDNIEIASPLIVKQLTPYALCNYCIAFKYDHTKFTPTTVNLFVTATYENQEASYEWNNPTVSPNTKFLYLYPNMDIGVFSYYATTSSMHTSFFTTYEDTDYLSPVTVLDGDNKYGNDMSIETQTRILNFLESLPRDKKPFEEVISVVGGGDGTLTETNDNNYLDSIATINGNSVLRTWFATQYQLTVSQLQEVASVFWTDNFATNLKKFFNDPMESIINLSMLPIGCSDGTLHNVVIGSFDTGVTGATTVYNQFVEVDCGNLDVQEYWGSALDYSPNTEIEIFLPFIGIQTIQTDDIMKSTINLKYRIDTLTGTCNAFLTRIKEGVQNILYQWQGNCSYSVPITASNYNQFISGMIQATVSVGTTIASGGGSALSLISGTSSLATSSKTHVNKSGNFVCASGFMGYRTPYLILNRPCQSLPDNMEHYNGFQSNITSELLKIKGFTKVKTIQLKNVNCTDFEKTEIERLLKEGVIF